MNGILKRADLQIIRRAALIMQVLNGALYHGSARDDHIKITASTHH